MADKKPTYWERRAIDREKSYQEGSDKTVGDIQRVYDKAFADIELRIKSLDKKLKAEADPESAAALLSRSYELQQMERDIYETFAKAARIEQRVTASRYAAVMEKAYYFATFDIQKGVGFAYGFNLIPKRAIDAALNARWLNHNYRESIWKNSAKAAMAASDIVISGLASGRSNEDMSAELESVMGAGMTAARRLIRTETNYFSNQGELEAYKEAGLLRYRFLATLDSATSKQCRAHDGLIDPDTQQEYLVKNAQAGLNFPPLHAWCRSSTVIVIDNNAKAALRTRRAKDPATGKYYTVPQNMTYNEWYEQYVKGSANIPLTDSEKHAINKYISSESYFINEKLRDGAPLPADEQKLVADFDNALKKLPYFKGGVSRSVDLRGKKLESFLSAHSVNTEVTYPAYTSFTDNLGDNVNEKIQIYVESARGRDIRTYNAMESEVVYERGARFRVKHVENKDGVITIRLEEL